MSLIELLNAFGDRWRLPSSAVMELRQVLAAFDAAPAPLDAEHLSGEARVQSLVRLEAPGAGYWLTRNNVGALKDNTGRFVRYGLANESKQQNELVKSGDLIGWRRRVIITADVGTVIAQFASREVKKEGWEFNPNDDHEGAQAAWRDFVNSNGGDAAFVSGPGSFITTLPPPFKR